jgi:hypothetical protein
MLRQFAEVIKEENLDNEVLLVGSFCLECCGECLNWKFDNEQISSKTVAEAVDTLRRRLGEFATKT